MLTAKKGVLTAKKGRGQRNLVQVAPEPCCSLQGFLDDPKFMCGTTTWEQVLGCPMLCSPHSLIHENTWTQLSYMCFAEQKEQ